MNDSRGSQRITLGKTLEHFPRHRPLAVAAVEPLPPAASDFVAEALQRASVPCEAVIRAVTAYLLIQFLLLLADRSVPVQPAPLSRKRLSDLEAKLDALQSQTREQAALRDALACLDSFSDTIHANLDQADWNTRREILRTLVERVVVEPDQIRVVYRINFPLFAKTQNASNGKVLHFCWRSDVAMPCKPRRPAARQPVNWAQTFMPFWQS